MNVVGVDGCKRGWIAIALDEGGSTRGLFVERLDDLGAALDGVHAVAIDIPIGLPSTGRRCADDAAREVLGARRNSVFYAPGRDAITAATHADASAISKRITGHGISRQSFALAPKILEAERWAASTTVPVWEVHPEVSFAVMLGHPAQHPKLTWAGLRERLDALRDAGIVVGDIGAAGAMAGADDVLDATVAAWSAARLYRGGGISLPDPPETASDQHDRWRSGRSCTTRWPAPQTSLATAEYRGSRRIRCAHRRKSLSGRADVGTAGTSGWRAAQCARLGIW